MKLLYRIIGRISVALLLLFALWSVVFYRVMIDEINDETDDSLEDYSESIIIKALSGEDLPDSDNGTTNSYYITPVSEEYAASQPTVSFHDEEVYVHAKRETEPARVYKTVFRDRENRYFELTVSVPVIEKNDLKQTILFWIVALYLLLLIAILIVNAMVLRRSLRPLYALLDWLDRLKPGEPVPPLDLHTDITEFRKLSDSVLRSAQRSAEAYEQQSLFIGNASHELQTPIAVAINRLELLADDPEITRSQLEQILKTRRSLEDIAKLNKTLLLLTRIENRQFDDDTEVNVNELLHTLGGDLSESYAFTGIGITYTEPTALSVRINRMLASVLLGNLLKNAFVHNRPQGRVAVVVEGSRVTISNTAVGEALNPDYIFRRFYQGDKTEGSTGLGLSLAESISKLYGITLSYRYDTGWHRFEISFPEKRVISA
jgi:signal transduction histidine kinase